MPLVVTDAGEKALLDVALRGDTTKRPYRLRLFVNDYLPHEYSTPGQVTPATFGGYADLILDPAQWQPAVTVAGTAESVYGSMAHQWLSTGLVPQRVYGYYVVTEDGAILIWAERFNEPVDIAPGGTFQLRPMFSGRSKD